LAAYALPNAIPGMTGILDALGIEAAHVVGRDFIAAVAGLTAMLRPDPSAPGRDLVAAPPGARMMRQNEGLVPAVLPVHRDR
jgi:pimeloyl-ACP methyl ester carboxylesterase